MPKRTGEMPCGCVPHSTRMNGIWGFYCETEQQGYCNFECPHEEEALDETIARCKREILEDIAKGTVPASVSTFSELHDYVDANCYGGMCDDDFAYREFFSMEDGNLDLFNDVTDTIDGWLRRGEHRKA